MSILLETWVISIMNHYCGYLNALIEHIPYAIKQYFLDCFCVYSYNMCMLSVTAYGIIKPIRTFAICSCMSLIDLHNVFDT